MAPSVAAMPMPAAAPLPRPALVGLAVDVAAAEVAVALAEVVEAGVEATPVEKVPMLDAVR